MWKFCTLIILLPALNAFETLKNRCDIFYDEVHKNLPIKDCLKEDKFLAKLDTALTTFIDREIASYLTYIEKTHQEFGTSHFMTSVMTDEISYCVAFNHRELMIKGADIRRSHASVFQNPFKLKEVETKVKLDMVKACTNIFEHVDDRVSGFEGEVRNIAIQLEKDRFLAVAAAFDQKIKELMSVCKTHGDALKKDVAAFEKDIETLKMMAAGYSQVHASKKEIEDFFKSKQDELVSKYAKFVKDAHGKMAALPAAPAVTQLLPSLPVSSGPDSKPDQSGASSADKPGDASAAPAPPPPASGTPPPAPGSRR